jgi:hypothetical protein
MLDMPGCDISIHIDGMVLRGPGMIVKWRRRLP